MTTGNNLAHEKSPGSPENPGKRTEFQGGGGCQSFRGYSPMTILSFAAWTGALILALIALLHVYWAFGGRWGAAAAIPEIPGKGAAFRPGFAATLLVALALGVAVGLILARIEVLPRAWPRALETGLLWAGAAVFGLRALGEFRYVGFFARVRDTRFARMDRRLYSPLCLGLAGLFGALAFAAVT